MTTSKEAPNLTVDVEDVLEILEKAPPPDARRHLRAPPNTLCAVGVIGEIYSSLTRATISLDAIKTSIDSAIWYKALISMAQNDCIDLSVRGYRDIPNEIAFACLAMMETGTQNLDPAMLQNVMGMACGDSIYVSNSLALDPYNFADRCGIFHALGNVGKPGVSLLLPPPDPIVRKPTADEWNIITHSRWDAKEHLDLFGKTSLQLVLTEYRVPYVTQHRGVRDSQTFFQEATISVYDGAAWVGDVDIVKELFTDLTRRRMPGECPHGELCSEDEKMSGATPTTKSSKARRKRRGETAGSTEAHSNRIRSIVNWHEVLDKPSEPAVVLTKGNWIARLATAAISSQLGYKTTILPEKYCDKGCFSDLGFMGKAFGQEGGVIVL